MLTIMSEGRVKGGTHPKFATEPAGGAPACSGENTLQHGTRRRRLPSKLNMRVEAGDRRRIATSGGGGYGTPPP